MPRSNNGLWTGFSRYNNPFPCRSEDVMSLVPISGISRRTRKGEVSPRWGLVRGENRLSINMSPRWGCATLYITFLGMRYVFGTTRGRGNITYTNNLISHIRKARVGQQAGEVPSPLRRFEDLQARSLQQKSLKVPDGRHVYRKQNIKTEQAPKVRHVYRFPKSQDEKNAQLATL